MSTLIALSSLLLVMGVFLLYLMIRLPRGYLLKYAAVPVFIFLIGFTCLQLPSILGLPVDEYPSKEFKLFSYRDTWKDDKHVIELWIVEDSNTSKLYRIPYSKPTEDALQAMMQAGKSGKHVKGKFGKLDGNNGNSYSLGIKDIPSQNLPLKPPAD